MPFCTNCGSQINSEHKFCNNCGQSLQPTTPNIEQTPPPPPQNPAPQAYQPPPTGEQIIGVIEQCKYGFPANTYSIFITEKRIIVAKTGGLGANLTSAGVASGGLIGGLIGAGLDARSQGGMSKKTLEYISLTPEQMLVQDKKNFQMYIKSIQSVEMKKPGFIGQGEIKFKTVGKDHRFMLEVSKEIFQSYIMTLSQALSGRIILK